MCPNAPTITTRAFAEQAAEPAGTRLRLQPTPRWQLRVLGRFVPAVGEIVEVLYEFVEDFVVDHTPYATLLGDHATPLDEALAATLKSVAARTAPSSDRADSKSAIVRSPSQLIGLF